MNSSDRPELPPPKAAIANLSELVMRELAANEEATAKALAADRISAKRSVNGDDDKLAYWRRGRPGDKPNQEGSSEAVAWQRSPDGTPKYRYLTSIELVTAICVAAVGLSKLASKEKPTQDKREELKTTEELDLEQGRDKKDETDEQSQWADLERDLKDSSWITENAKGMPLAKVKNEVVVCSLDRNLNFSSLSDAVFAHWGYRGQELIGRSIMGLVKSEDVQCTLEALRELVANKTGLAFENWIRHKDGKWMAMSWSAYWSDEDNRVIAIAKDITAQKEVERRRQEAVQMVSHDLRSPLTSIQFSLELLAEGASGALSPEALEDVRIAQNNTTQLINLVNDLLDLEKIEHGMLRMNLGKVNLDEVLQSAADSIRFLARSRKIEIALPTTDLVVFADKDRIVQVLINILSNAIKFSPENSTITIECQGSETWAEVKVSDQGPGIPSKYKEAIFERFKQIEGREGVGQKGAGLGLAICKSIIDGHKGQIGVESGQALGSTFWFRIPLFEKRTANSPFGKIVRHLGFRAQAGS